MIKLCFVGDIMPGGVLPYQNQYISSELKDFLKGFDLRIGTLEAAIGTNLPFDPVKTKGRQNIVYARNEDFFRIKEMGIDVVSLANNHVWDLGEDGLKNTIETLMNNNVQFFGAGLDIEEASKPVVIKKNGLSIALLGYCMYGNKWLGYVELAGKKKAGINPLDIEKVLNDIKNAHKKSDRVIVMPHWGREYRFDPLPECIEMAKQMIDAGADAVLGSHPHQVQPFIKYKKGYICFSMGNFLFPDFYMYPPRPIWYPENIDEVEHVKDVIGYPYPIEEPIRQVWNPISRYGCIVELEINDKTIKATTRFVHSSEENIVGLSEVPKEIRFQLWKNEKMIKYKTFNAAVKCVRRIRQSV